MITRRALEALFFIVIPKPPPWAVVIEPWGYCPNECPC
ncbi:rfbP protein [Vibrio aestuarianus]|nr:rfbP protein [Vibrio aestuarianus]